MILHIILRAARVFKLYSIFSSIIISLSLCPYQSAYSQDYEKMVDITKAMNMVLAELDSCKNDLDCMLIVSKKLEKLTKELEAAQNKKTSTQNKNISNTNNQTVEPPKIPIPPSTGQQPNLTPSGISQGNFPPPFESISKPWLEHITAANPKPGELADCQLINKTREKFLNEISKVYIENDNIIPWEYPLTISFCNDAKVVTKELGEINVPHFMSLKYNIRTEEKPLWIANYNIYIDEYNYRLSDVIYFKLLEASSSASVINEHKGWILDNSVDPPVTVPLDKVSFLSEKDENTVWKDYYGGNNIFYTKILPVGYNAKGEVTEYLLWLHSEPARFYPAGQPEDYIGSAPSTVNEKLTRDEIITALKQESYNAYYNEIDFTGTSNVTKEVTITFKSTECDKDNSAGNGAIVLSGDCIDHGGNVIASKSSFLVNNKLVAHIGDKVLCKKHGLTKIIASKMVDVLNDNKQVARIGDQTECGATIIGGSKNTFAGIK